jgi:hypothetical protein
MTDQNDIRLLLVLLLADYCWLTRLNSLIHNNLPEMKNTPPVVGGVLINSSNG